MKNKILGIITTILGIIGILFVECIYIFVREPTQLDELFLPIALLIGCIGVIILITSAISFFSLKRTVKKQNMMHHKFDLKEKQYTDVYVEKIEEKKKSMQRKFYMWGMILSITGLTYLKLKYDISIIIFLIPIILFVISFMVRLTKKKISNIICGISVLLVCIIAIWNVVPRIILENYNEQFNQYIKEELPGYPSYYTTDVEGLINSAIKNNKIGRKVNFIYQDTNYTTVDELTQLLSKLDTKKTYSVQTTYLHYYIESITLGTYASRFFSDFVQFEGEQRGSVVKALLSQVQNTINSTYEDLKINMIYTNETNQIININVSSDNVQEITDLRNDIDTSKTYKIEIQSNVSNEYECTIIITSNN